MSSDFRAILRRFKPDKRRVSLKPRPAAELPFIERNLHKPQKLLYDTTVYIDVLQGRFPHQAEYVLRSAEAWHSTVTEGELAVSCGLLSPTHPKSRASLEQIVSVIERRPAHRTLGPDREIWRTAGVLLGMLARLQGYGKQETRRLLNDALLFLTAKKYGCTLLTRNVTDFDFLNQIEPAGQILFYRI